MVLSEYLLALASSQQKKVDLIVLDNGIFPRLYPITACVASEI